MKKVINIAMIGSGSMGRTHSAALSSLRYCYKDLPFEARLHTLVTRSEDGAAEKAQALGFRHYSTDLDCVLGDPNIDVIDVCTPNICHHSEVIKAVRAGKSVLCEKPLGISSAEASEMALEARKGSATYGVVFNNRHLPAILRARELVDEGRLGDIVSFRSAYLHSSSADPKKPRGWKQDRDICGGGVLFDLGSHAIDLLTYVLGGRDKGRIDAVRGLSQIVYPTRAGEDGKDWQTNADEAFYITARLAGGGCGTIEASKVSVGANDDFTLDIYGTKGAIKFNLMNPNYLRFYDAEGKSAPHGGERGFTAIECVGRYDMPSAVFPGMRAPIGWMRGHVHGMYSFISAVSENRKASPDFDDGAYINYVMEAAYKSDKSGREEKITIS